MDHFHDALGVSMSTHMTVYMLTESNWHVFNMLLLTICGTYLTHFETANSGVMYLPEYISISEAQLMGVAIHLLTGIMGIGY